uniref:SCP domain-containing protein n=1 Tax=Angiostrongylus cantonensis TaxID=6313 RepID=A0A0K0DFV7_ANGCA
MILSRSCDRQAKTFSVPYCTRFTYPRELEGIALSYIIGEVCPNADNTDEMRNTYLKYHNDSRSRLAKGEESVFDRKLGATKCIYKLLSILAFCF